MQKVGMFLAASLIVSTAAVAQAKPPHKMLTNLNRYLGTYEGSGTAMMGPNEEKPWTSTITISEILDGHFVVDDTVVKMAGQPDMRFLTYFGWNEDAQKLEAYVCSNAGDFQVAEVDFTAAGLMVAFAGPNFDGSLTLAREVYKPTAAGFDFTMERTFGANPMSTLVKGSFKRLAAKADGAAKKEERVAGMLEKGVPNGMQPPEEMSQLEKLYGSWSVAGSMNAGGQSMKITGTQSMSPIMGGHVMFSNVAGEPGGYKAHSLTAWNAKRKCYDYYFFNNMGECGTATARWTDEKTLVLTVSRMKQGMPSAMRSVYEVKDDGSLSTYSDALLGSMPAARMFEATYTKSM